MLFFDFHKFILQKVLKIHKFILLNMLKIHKFEYSVQKFSLACRKNATKVQNETELMLLKGDVLRTGIKCRAN